jgi:hypothetical protein
MDGTVLFILSAGDRTLLLNTGTGTMKFWGGKFRNKNREVEEKNYVYHPSNIHI